MPGYVDELSVTGLTSNPTILEKAIEGGDAYDEATVLVFADHQHVRSLLPDHDGDVEQTLDRFEQSGIDLETGALRLQQEGAAAFSASWAKLLDCIAGKQHRLVAA